MPKIELPSDFAEAIADAFNWKLAQVNEIFDFEEDKNGYFVATLKPKKFLDKPEFQTLCRLVTDLGGEGYLKGAKAWKVSGPYAKKPDATSTPDKPGNARSKPWAMVKCTSCGDSVPVLPSDKEVHCRKCGQAIQVGKPVTTPIRKDAQGIIPESMKGEKPLYFIVPIKTLLSMAFQSRLIAEDLELSELVESVKTYGILEPVLVRPKPDGLYEIVAGERRVRAAQKAGLVEIPVNIKILSDEEAFIITLTENLQRKDLTEEEKSRSLGELARRTGWKAQQIANKLKMSYTWVVKYLPSEFKDEDKAKAGTLGGESRSETVQHSATQRVAESTENIVLCDSCGVAISAPVYLDGKFYCEQCARKTIIEPPAPSVPEAPEETPGIPEWPGLEPVTQARRIAQPTGPRRAEEEAEGEEEEPNEPTGASTPESKPEAIDIGEFECSECHQLFIVEHVAENLHRLKRVERLEEPK